MQGFDLSVILANPEFRAMLIKGIELTFIVAGVSWLVAMALALVLLTVRLTPSRLAQRTVAVYVSYHRNVPTLVQLMLWYFGISNLLPDAMQEWLTDHNGEAIFAIIALGLCQAAYFSEDMRSGLRAIPTGQAEAARALGHSYVNSMRYVILPQAIRNAIPALVNHTISLFKNSSLAMAIGVAELTHMVREIESRSFRTFEVYTVATVLYLGTSLVLMGLGAMLARRYSLAAAR
ncbi:amino acid ABC transporter permease [Acidisphaera sp. L21]|jgi:polar amino acid transport system permease protein|uniref:amino acid ABC transporter permease n=1 Tax=Acidisphaera sp. L21 TaxID=1641851 RepID=UPI00131CDF98|nr:amino acid ABC transporter permease [Acidisphaera sp. L21]